MCNTLIIICYKFVRILKANRCTIITNGLIMPLCYWLIFDVVLFRKNDKGINLGQVSFNDQLEKWKINAIYFSPTCPFTERLIKDVFAILNINGFGYDRYTKKFPNEEQLMSTVEAEMAYNNTNIGVIIFNNIDASTKMPENLNYKIRLFTDQRTLEYFQDRNYVDKGAIANPYVTNGFAVLQQSVNIAYGNMIKNGRTQKIQIRPIWDSRYKSMLDFQHSTLMVLIGIFIIFSPFVNSMTIISIWTKEKFMGARELLKLMGAGEGLNWFTWYLYDVLVNVPFLGIMIWFLNNLFSKIGIGYVVLIVLLYFNASLWFNYALANLFTEDLMLLLLFIPYVFGYYFFANEVILTSNIFLVFLLHLCPPMSFVNLFDNMSRMNSYVNVQKISGQKNFNESIIFDLCIYAFDICLYIFLVWYMDRVLPGKYGYAYPWNFLCSKSVVPMVDMPSGAPMASNNAQFQGNVSHLEVSVSVNNVYKMFKKSTAIKNVSIGFYKNQITALLGCNGAGKTTLLSMITGNIKPSNGEIIINGLNIKTNWNKIKAKMSYCPQNNINFPYMTVKEHLVYAHLLNGEEYGDAKDYSDRWLNDYNLWDKDNTYPKKLSGGMKRKLQLLMAIAGDKDVIVLDEPSSGLDPESRRDLWKIITDIRDGRTIILTTHSMEEADALANQVAIMDQGVLICYGTPVFLKNSYGIGYDLRVAMGNSNNEKVVTDIVTKSIPRAELTLFTGALALYQVPTLDSSLLSNMFSKLEARKKELSIVSLGLNVRSIEHIFLKVRNQEDVSSNRIKMKFNRKTGLWLCFWNIMALLYNYFIYFYRKILLFIAMYTGFGLMFYMMYSNIMWMNKSLMESKNKTYVFGMKMYSFPSANSYYSVEEGLEKIGKEFETVVPNPTKVEDVSTRLVELANENIDEYLRTTIVCAIFESSQTVGYYGTTTVHSVPEVINAIDNAFVRVASDGKSSISTAFQPIVESQNIMTDGLIGSLTLYFFILSFPFIIFASKHAGSGVKRLQFMAGIDPLIYWTIYILLMFVFVIPIVVLIFHLLIYANESTIFKDSDDIYQLKKIIFLHLLEFTLFIICNIILFTEWIKVVYSLGIIYTVHLVIPMIYETQILSLGKAQLRYIENFIPLFYYGKVVGRHMESIQLYKKCMLIPEATFDICEDITLAKRIQFCCDMECKYGCKKMYLENTLSKMTQQFLINIYLYLALIIILENNILGKIIWCFCNCSSSSGSDISDVNNEIQHVEENWNLKPTDPNCDHMLVKKVHKTFIKWYGKCFQAVENVTFSFKRGECFGLLGTNGAGKSTMFNVLTHSINATRGDAKINTCGTSSNCKPKSWKLNIQWPCFLRHFGYCPQTNAIDESFTTYENLKINALLKGVPFNFLENEINYWIDALGLQNHKFKKSGSLSGGNIRKLCVANALIGGNEIIYLDEPTSGVDPLSRHNIWHLLTDIRNSGQSIVLTSHSMDECEALCERLLILVEGEVKCIGPIEYLKHNYTQGFKVQIQLTTQIDEVMTNRIIRTVEQVSPTTVKDKTPGFLTLILVDGKLNLSVLFDQMEKVKKAYSQQIAEFTITDTSLEDIFIVFAEKRNMLL